MSDLTRIPIIDIDTHFTEPADLWTSRAPAKYRDQVLCVKDTDSGGQGWFYGDEPVASLGNNVIRRDGSKERGTLTLGRYDEMGHGGMDPAARLADMNKLGVWAQLVYPNVIGFGASVICKLTDDLELRNFHVRAYNDAIADLQAQGEGRLYPQAVLPFWDLDLSLRELERCREQLALTGFSMTNRPQDFGLPSLSDPYWKRFFEACESLELPINFHIGSGGTEGVVEHYWRKDATQMESIAFVSVSLFMSNFRDIVNLIMTGVCERHPRLNFVSVESGAGWVPFILQSLDYTFDEMLTASDRSRFSLRPSQYFHRQIYASYWFEDSISDYVQQIGSGNLMFETDYPHPQSLYPDVVAKVEQTLGDQDAATQRKILCDNAARVYGIEAPREWSAAD